MTRTYDVAVIGAGMAGASLAAELAIWGLLVGASLTTLVLRPRHRRTILAMTASFQEQQEGLEHQERAPEAPGPEDLPTTAQVLAGIDHPVATYWSTWPSST